MSAAFEAAIGKWPEILHRLGINVTKNKYTACPICGGKDRFRFDDVGGRGTFYCNRCGAGNGFNLVCLATNWTMRRVFKEIEKLANVTTASEIPKEEQIDENKRKALLNKVWAEGKPVTLEDPAGQYLFNRTGLKVFGPTLRYHPALWHSDQKKSYPALLAKVTDKDNKPVNIHRTYITDEKITKKKLMKGQLPAGSAIRLMPYENEIGIAEGIETAISAWAIFGIPTWAAVSALGIERWEPPPVVEKVWIFGDNDHSYTGQMVAYKAAYRLFNTGTWAKVCIPRINGADWNDVLKLYGTQEARKLSLELLPIAT